MMTIILHVGAGKCGSSSLQTQLSGKPLLQSDDGSALYEYVRIGPDGNLGRGDELERTALLAPHDSQVSVGAEQAWGSEEEAIERLASQLKAVLAEGRTPIASCESWLYQSEIFRNNALFKRLGVRAKIIVFVRPQTQWLNSAWWQWGAWASWKFDDWVESIKHSPLWAKLIAEWRSMPGVESVEVHLATGDVVSTFFRSIGVSVENPQRRNTSLDGNLLQYLRGRPDLRAKLGTGIEFILEKRLAAEPKGMPWVLQQDQISRLIEYYRADNTDLLALLSREARLTMECDPLWWDAAAYRERQAVSADAIEPGIQALEDISHRAIDAVVRLDEHVRALEVTRHEHVRVMEVTRHEHIRVMEDTRCEHVRALEITRREFVLALEAEKLKRFVPRFRKAVSINGIRRLVGV